MGKSIRVYQFDEDKTSILPIPGSPFEMENYSAGFAMHSSGRFLYATKPEEAAIAVYSVDTRKGTLTPMPGSPFAVMEWLESLTISGNLLMLKSRKAIGTYAIDSETGNLHLLGKSQRIAEPQLPAEEVAPVLQPPAVNALQAKYSYDVVNRDSEISLLNVNDGSVCANVYAFSTDEKLISCCSCSIPTYGNITLPTVSLVSVQEHIKNVIVRVVNTIATKRISCEKSAAKAESAEFPLNPDRLVFVTTIDSMSIQNPSGLAERSFQRATYNPAELTELVNRCAQINSPHFGQCRACRIGAIARISLGFGEN